MRHWCLLQQISLHDKSQCFILVLQHRIEQTRIDLVCFHLKSTQIYSAKNYINAHARGLFLHNNTVLLYPVCIDQTRTLKWHNHHPKTFFLYFVGPACCFFSATLKCGSCTFHKKEDFQIKGSVHLSLISYITELSSNKPEQEPWNSQWMWKNLKAKTPPTYFWPNLNLFFLLLLRIMWTAEHKIWEKYCPSLLTEAHFPLPKHSTLTSTVWHYIHTTLQHTRAHMGGGGWGWLGLKRVAVSHPIPDRKKPAAEG